MSGIITVDVRLTPAEFDNAERVIEQLQKMYLAMTVDDAIDFIFKVGTLHLHDQSVIDFEAPFGQAGQQVVAVLR